MTEHVKIEIADGIMTLTLRRPEKKNALTGAMYDAFSKAMATASPPAMISPTSQASRAAKARSTARPTASSRPSAR